MATGRVELGWPTGPAVPQPPPVTVGLGRALRSMSKVDEALSSGAISIEHAHALAGCRRFAPVEFAGDEAFLLAAAVEQRSWENFQRVIAHWRDAVHPDGADRDADRAYQRRRLVLHRRGDGTMSIQDGELDALGAEAFLSELDRLERAMFEADWSEADGDPARLPRTVAQRRADALVEMAYRSRTAPADGRRPDPLVSVYIDYETLTGRLCELASGVQVTPKQVLPLFTRAEIERVIFGPANRVIELGVRERFFTGGLRRAIELRDRHCQWPGCTAPVAGCQIDHVDRHADGGLTTQSRGRAMCPHHNRVRNRLPTDPFDWEAAPEDEAADLAALIALYRRRLADAEARYAALAAT